MRTILISLSALASITLAGCVVSGPDRVDADRPSVTYDLDHPGEYDQAAARAEEYCSENYGRDARLVDEPSADDTVTFECIGD